MIPYLFRVRHETQLLIIIFKTLSWLCRLFASIWPLTSGQYSSQSVWDLWQTNLAMEEVFREYFCYHFSKPPPLLPTHIHHNKLSKLVKTENLQRQRYSFGHRRGLDRKVLVLCLHFLQSSDDSFHLKYWIFSITSCQQKPDVRIHWILHFTSNNKPFWKKSRIEIKVPSAWRFYVYVFHTTLSYREV